VSESFNEKLKEYKDKCKSNALELKQKRDNKIIKALTNTKGISVHK